MPRWLLSVAVRQNLLNNLVSMCSVLWLTANLVRIRFRATDLQVNGIISYVALPSGTFVRMSIPNRGLSTQINAAQSEK
jgi:hypothetical protein